MVFHYILYLHHIIVIVQFSPVLLQNYYTTPGSVLSTTFVPEIKLPMCLLKPDTGPCRANIMMYHFDPATGECANFSWGGCQGNGNRFDSENECEDVCLTKPNEPKTKPRFCHLAFDYGFCFGDIKRWYYDKRWKVCKETIYSGCGGNKNNFYSYEQCDSVCRIGKGSLGTFHKIKKDGVRKVVYVLTSSKEIRSTKPTKKRPRWPSPKPRYSSPKLTVVL